MSVTDPFTRANGGPGANWTVQQNAPQITSNQLTDSESNAGYGSMFWSANAFNADHSSQVTGKNGSLYMAPGTRHSATGGSTNWYAYFNNGSTQKSVAGSITNIGSPTAWGNADVAKLTSVGTTHTPNLNGSDGTPFTDSSLSIGSAGVAFFDALDGPLLDDWVGTGEIVVATFVPQQIRDRRPYPFAPGSPNISRF